MTVPAAKSDVDRRVSFEARDILLGTWRGLGRSQLCDWCWKNIWAKVGPIGRDEATNRIS